jgi:hypothetical protein
MSPHQREQLEKSGHITFSQAIKNSNAVKSESVVVKKPILKLAIITSVIVGVIVGMAWARAQEANREYLKASIAGEL